MAEGADQDADAHVAAGLAHHRAGRLTAAAAAYEAALGTALWGLTVQNEPLQDPGWQSMRFSGETERAPGQEERHSQLQRLLSRPFSTHFG